MARNVTSAAANRITVSMGALAFTGDVTMVRVWKRAATDAGTRVHPHVGTDSGATRYLMSQNSNNLQITVGSSSVANAATGVAADGPWVLQAVQKATGSNHPRFHKYVYSTDIWTHQNTATNLANGSTPTGSAYLLNRATASTAAACSGDHAISAVYNAVLTDYQIEAMAYALPAWFAVQPKGLWLFDQAAVTQQVFDLSGNGANETARTGTTVSTLNVPVFSYGAEVQPAQFSGAIPASLRPLLNSIAAMRSSLY